MGIFDSSYNIRSKSVGMSQRPKLKPSEEPESLFPSRTIHKSVSERKAHPRPWRFAQLLFPARLKAGRRRHRAGKFTLVGQQAKFESRESPAKCTLDPGAQTAQKHKEKLRQRSVRNEIKTEKMQKASLFSRDEETDPRHCFLQVIVLSLASRGWIPCCL